MADVTQQQSKSRRRLWMAVLVMMFLPGILSVLYLSTAPRKPIDSIAVLPFRYANGDADAAALSSGITGQLTKGLSQLPNLTVIPQDTSMRYAGRQIDAKTAGHELGARAVVKGEIERQGANLIVRAELDDSGDNSVIWSEQYVVKASEIGVRQDELTRDIQENIRFH
jgi:TolB-like protein